MFVLEKLWRGEITPSEKYMRQGGEYQKKLRQLCEIGDQLEKELTPKGKNLLKAFTDAKLDLQTIESRESFIDGFRMGAGLILDVVTDYAGEFQYPTEE